MWESIGQDYRKSSISNLLYLSRINRNLENAFLYVIGSDIDQIKSQWEIFYESRYSNQANTLDPYDDEHMNVAMLHGKHLARVTKKK